MITGPVTQCAPPFESLVSSRMFPSPFLPFLLPALPPCSPLPNLSPTHTARHVIVACLALTLVSHHLPTPLYGPACHCGMSRLQLSLHPSELLSTFLLLYPGLSSPSTVTLRASATAMGDPQVILLLSVPWKIHKRSCCFSHVDFEDYKNTYFTTFGWASRFVVMLVTYQLSSPGWASLLQLRGLHGLEFYILFIDNHLNENI